MSAEAIENRDLMEVDDTKSFNFNKPAEEEAPKIIDAENGEPNSLAKEQTQPTLGSASDANRRIS